MPLQHCLLWLCRLPQQWVLLVHPLVAPFQGRHFWFRHCRFPQHKNESLHFTLTPLQGPLYLSNISAIRFICPGVKCPYLSRHWLPWHLSVSLQQEQLRQWGRFCWRKHYPCSLTFFPSYLHEIKMRIRFTFITRTSRIECRFRAPLVSPINCHSPIPTSLLWWCISHTIPFSWRTFTPIKKLAVSASHYTSVVNNRTV